MQIRRAETVDAETLAKAEYETTAAQEGLLAAQPGEIPVGSFREKIEAGHRSEIDVSNAR